MKIKFTLLFFLLLVTFSAIANYNLPKEKLKKVKLQLNNKTFELCVPKGYMLSINSRKSINVEGYSIERYKCRLL